MSESSYYRQIAVNRRARHDYHILEKLEAGMVLRGTEVKAMRNAKVQLKDGFVEFRNGEAFLNSVHVAPYSHGNLENHDPERPRKLLLHKRQIERLAAKVQTKGVTVVPLRVYLQDRRVKVEIALVQGKKLWDKRQTERERDLEREAREAMKTAVRGN